MKRPDFRQISSIIELIGIYDSDLMRIASFDEVRQQEVSDSVKRLIARQAGSILRDMDVDNINRDKLGIRVSALKAAGILDMEQLCSMSADQINEIRGIGDDAAYLIYSIAGRIRQEVYDGLKLKISVEDKNEDATGLIKTINCAINTTPYISQANELCSQYHEEIEKACRIAKTASGAFSWMFASSAKKSEALNSAEYLYSLVSGDYANRAKEIIDGFDANNDADGESCWDDFEKNSAAYFARLEQLNRDSGTAIDNSYSGLPAELVREVQLQQINVDKLKATLRSYQDFGVRYILRQGDVLLGDEMGLGKTVQAIAVMVSLAASGATHFMVVCPASVLVNWAREVVQFCDLPVTMIRGGDIMAVRKWVSDGGVAVTTYESISRFGLPENFTFSLLVADEAHYVKNPLARRTQSLMVLRRRAERALFMTGTPLENNVDEMCFIIRCLRADISEELEEIKYISSAPQFREKLAPVYLRRTREDVLDELPALIEKEQWCEMGAEEWKNYLLSVISENFMAMRQVSWDVPDLKKSSKAQRLLEICSMAEEEGRKVIVFSFFRSTIDAVHDLLGAKALEPITGSMSAMRRQQIVDEFTAAPNGTVLICQVQAGGTGLNIQAASVIIFCEPQIKPSIENQAISRAYRMGQLRTVVVHRLLCDNTVDERILELLREKQDVFDSFAEESATGSEYMKAEKSITSAIVAMEKERLEGAEAPEELPEEE